MGRSEMFLLLLPLLLLLLLLLFAVLAGRIADPLVFHRGRKRTFRTRKVLSTLEPILCIDHTRVEGH